MRKIASLFALLVVLPVGSVYSSTQDLDALVESVRQEALQEASYDQERIERFLAERTSQTQLLAEARQRLTDETNRADRLRDNYEGNELTLTQYEADLEERAGDLNDLFAIVRQTAVNANSVLSTSLVAAEQEDQSSFLLDLGKGERKPSIDDIRQMWTMILSEIAESGKVVRFNATVIKPQGDENQQVVTRAGVFNSVSDGKFLRYLPDSGKLVELSRQPATRFQGMAEDLEEASVGMHAFPLDPSKGAILSLMVQSPDLKERLAQGGGIGYLILILGAIGLLMVIQRAISLLMARRGIEAQAKSDDVDEKNPLGRMQKIANGITNHNIDAISMRLDEQLGEESSLLSRGLPTIAVLAAVSPLLGLLGTVTGMIETFQQITLFGTGDPKMMSGGISQALVTTQLGLSVAIPLVMFHSLLTGRANRLVEKLGKYSSDIVTHRELD